MISCQYGCGREASFIIGNGKHCCSKKHNSCPKMREKNSEGTKKSNKGTKAQYKEGKRISHFIEYNKTHFRHKSGVWKHSEETRVELKQKNSRTYGDEFRKNRSDEMNLRYSNGWMPKAGRCKD